MNRFIGRATIHDSDDRFEIGKMFVRTRGGDVNHLTNGLLIFVTRNADH